MLRAFGVAEHVPQLLDGGRGRTWRAGDVVLRPHGDVLEARWRSDTLARFRHTAAFRTPRPVTAVWADEPGRADPAPDRWLVDAVVRVVDDGAAGTLDVS